MSNTPQDNFQWNDKLIGKFVGTLLDEYHKGGTFDSAIAKFKASQPVSSSEGRGWEIVRVRNKYHYTDRTFDLVVHDGRKTINGQNYEYVLNCLDRKYTIEAIKRLSDGEVFTVGDSYTPFMLNSIVRTIVNFSIKEDKLCVYAGDKNGPYTHLENINKAPKEPIKEVLFTDHAGNVVYEGDKFCAVQRRTFDILTGCNYRLYNPDDWVTFKEESAAREYIVMNKPCLSLAEIFKTDLNLGRREQILSYKDKLIELTKEKLNYE